MRSATTLFALISAASCSVSLDIDPEADVACRQTRDCPGNWVCIEALEECAPRTAPCVERAGQSWVASPDGQPCNRDDGSRGVCVAAECISSLCGDGIIALDEDCEEEPGTAAFDNPNDGCLQCRHTRWRAQVILGAYGGGAPATEVPIGQTYGMTMGPDGSLYAADPVRHRIWRVPAGGGAVTIAAGSSVAGYSGDGYLATAASLNGPQGVASDRIGNLYIADTLNNAIRRVGIDGIITTVAGGDPLFCGQTDAPCGDGGPAVDAGLRNPVAVAVDWTGEIYFSSDITHVVRRITTTGIIERVAGTYYANATTGCLDGEEFLTRPSGLSVREGVVYIADAGNERIVKAEAGEVVTVAGMCRDWGNDGDGGPAILARLDIPTDVAIDSAGNLYIGDLLNRRVRVVRPDGTIEALVDDVGVGVTTNAIPGQNEWTWRVIGLTVDREDRLFFGASLQRRIWRIDVDGTTVPIAGNGATGILVPGTSAGAVRVLPQGLAFDANDRLLFSDTLTDRVWRVEADGTLSVFAGSGVREAGGDGGAATDAGMTPRVLTNDDAGKVWIADDTNYRVREVASDGTVSTVAGSGEAGGDRTGEFFTGLAGDTAIAVPTALAHGADGSLYIGSNLRVRRLSSGTIEHFAGNGDASVIGSDGLVATETPLWDIEGIGFDASGRLCVSLGWQQVHCVDGGVFRHTVGTDWGSDGEGGPATAAQLRNPKGLIGGGGAAWECAGSQLLIAEQRAFSLRCLASDGTLHTIAGQPAAWPDGTSGDHGAATDAQLNWPVHVARDSHGNLYVAEVSAIRRIDNTGTITTVVGALHPGDGDLNNGYLVHPSALVAIDDDRFLIAEGRHGQVRHVDVALDTVSSIAGYPAGLDDSGGEDVAAITRLFDDAAGIAIDDSGARTRVYVSEREGHVIRRVILFDPADVSTWTISVAAGVRGEGRHIDGNNTNARLHGPAGMSISHSDRRLYFTETGSHTVRYLELDGGRVATVAGTAELAAFLGDGIEAAEALFDSPETIFVAADGSLVIADTGNHRVRRIDGAGLIHTIVGNGVPSSIGDGAPASAFPISHPRGVAVDAYGNVWVASSDSVRVVTSDDGEVANADDRVITIYGTPPRLEFPETATHCLTGLRLNADGATVHALDACQGYLLTLEREVPSD